MQFNEHYVTKVPTSVFDIDTIRLLQALLHDISIIFIYFWKGSSSRVQCRLGTSLLLVLFLGERAETMRLRKTWSVQAYNKNTFVPSSET